jgi:hypothetical protein
MPIYAATMGGKMVFGSRWLHEPAVVAIVAAFGAEGTEVIRKTNDYLNRIATTDPQRALLLAGFINEDPLLVCSLVETSKVRTLDGDGFAYINTNFKPTAGIPFEIVYHSYLVKNSTRQIEGWNASQWWGTNGNGSSFGQNGSGITFVEGELNEIVISYSGTGNTPISLNGNRAGNPVFVSTDFHAFHINGWNNECMRDRRRDIIIVENGTPIREMYPMQRTDGTCGMLDIVSGTFHPNANTEGSFTIQLTDKTPA